MMERIKAAYTTAAYKGQFTKCIHKAPPEFIISFS